MVLEPPSETVENYMASGTTTEIVLASNPIFNI
jgi:hypothetical protein